MENKTQICVLDFNENDISSLEDKITPMAEIYKGTVGNKVQLDYKNTKNYLFKLDNDIPPNLHEYDILVINQNDFKTIPYKGLLSPKREISGTTDHRIEVHPPTNIFDPRPISYNFLQDKISQFSGKKSLLIIFADKEYCIPYNFVKIEKSYIDDIATDTYSSYSFWEIPVAGSKYGERVQPMSNFHQLNDLLSEFELRYHQTFNQITRWNSEERRREIHPEYLGILKNSSDDIVSYAFFGETMTTFVFPDIKDKGAFLARFINEIVIDKFPFLFHQDEELNWLNETIYQVPNYERLSLKIEEERHRHKVAIENIEKKITDNQAKYQFLHDLITTTGDELVQSVIVFLRWLDFDKVIDFDEGKDDFFEEDIQIYHENRLLVIEVKGLLGTSKDRDCNQISKIRLRRMKEKDSTKVWALYIVNHSRLTPPNKRSNAFTSVQVEDAALDQRGLLTTWDLFKVYKSIEDGIFTKEEIQEQLFEFGQIDFKSNLDYVGKVDKIFKKQVVASLDLSGITVNVGDILIGEKNNVLTKYTVISIQKDKVSLENCSEGRVGLKLDKLMDTNTYIWKKSNQ